MGLLLTISSSKNYATRRKPMIRSELKLGASGNEYAPCAVSRNKITYKKSLSQPTQFWVHKTFSKLASLKGNPEQFAFGNLSLHPRISLFAVFCCCLLLVFYLDEHCNPGWGFCGRPLRRWVILRSIMVKFFLWRLDFKPDSTWRKKTGLLLFCARRFA